MSQGHDIVVIGASMGGLEALRVLLRDLPADLPAAIFVVWHVSPRSPRTFGQILDRAGELPAHLAEDGEAIRPGRIYAAPPDQHLLLRHGSVRLTNGPRENRARPAIDPLFRSAAVAYQTRVIGIVLSGVLDDGAAGLLAVKRCGGMSIVQDPADAAYAEMPRHALQTTEVDHSVAVAEMGELLRALVRQPAGKGPPVPADLILEVQLTDRITDNTDAMDKFGQRTVFSCPDCGGALWETQNETLPRFRCHIGHAYSGAALLDGQAEATEHALITALRTMEERIKVLERMAKQAEHAAGSAHSNYQEQAAELKQHTRHIRQIILGSSAEVSMQSSP